MRCGSLQSTRVRGLHRGVGSGLTHEGIVKVRAVAGQPQTDAKATAVKIAKPVPSRLTF